MKKTRFFEQEVVPLTKSQKAVLRGREHRATGGKYVPRT